MWHTSSSSFSIAVLATAALLLLSLSAASSFHNCHTFASFPSTSSSSNLHLSNIHKSNASNNNKNNNNNNNNNKMGNSNSKSSLEEGTASIIIPKKSNTTTNPNGSPSPATTTNTATTTAKTPSSEFNSMNIGRITFDSTNYETAKLYTPPSSKVKPLVHYIFLVHGWLGNDLEMSYLAEAFQNSITRLSSSHSSNSGGGSSTTTVSVGESGGTMEEEPDAKRMRISDSSHEDEQQQQEEQQKAKIMDIEEETTEMKMTENTINQQQRQPEIVIHSVKCNVGKTHDGIRNGGLRLANEITEFIRSDVRTRQQQQQQQQQQQLKLKLTTSTTSATTTCPNDDDQTNNNDEQDEQPENHVTFSIVGNSLGGLYSRYAISLIPYQLYISQRTSSSSSPSSLAGAASLIHLHPNIFCTTATPHLGVSRHTYLPIPRFAETIIGSGMGETGRDLFRLNSCCTNASNSNGSNSEERNLAGVVGGAVGGVVEGAANVVGGAVGGAVGVVGGGIRRLSSFRRNNGIDDNNNNYPYDDNYDYFNHNQDEAAECIIRTMCLDEKYLTPLRNFRQRVAYANAYGTDFQVPTQTAAFLSADSDVGHSLIASRDRRGLVRMEEGSEKGAGDLREKEEETGADGRGTVAARTNNHGENDSLEKEQCPSFIVAVLRTEKQSPPSSSPSSNDDNSLSSELLKMSQSLDALGWEKVFIDVRNRIPMPGISMPGWLRPSSWRSLDDLIQDRASSPSYVSSTQQQQQPPVLDNDTRDADAPTISANSNGNHNNNASSAATNDNNELIITSKELARSTTIAETLHFPLGHTVMVANSKSEAYSKLNSQGRPVMDKLAEDIIRDVLMFE